MTAEYFENSWRVCCFDGFLFGREAINRMKSHGGGTILFTGASASLRGRPVFGAFNSSKGGLRNLARQYGTQGIFLDAKRAFELPVHNSGRRRTRCFPGVRGHRADGLPVIEKR